MPIRIHHLFGRPAGGTSRPSLQLCAADWYYNSGESFVIWWVGGFPLFLPGCGLSAEKVKAPRQQGRLNEWNVASNCRAEDEFVWCRWFYWFFCVFFFSFLSGPPSLTTKRRATSSSSVASWPFAGRTSCARASRAISCRRSASWSRWKLITSSPRVANLGSKLCAAAIPAWPNFGNGAKKRKQKNWKSQDKLQKKRNQQKKTKKRKEKNKSKRIAFFSSTIIYRFRSLYHWVPFSILHKNE